MSQQVSGDDAADDFHVEIEHDELQEGTGNGLVVDNSLDHETVITEGDGLSLIQHYGANRPSNKPQGKRTIIAPYQKRTLEEFYRTGMTSAGNHLHHLHEAASDQTGLDITVIKNWVRNRRRPTPAQKLAMLQQSAAVSTCTFQPATLPNVTTITLPNIPIDGTVTMSERKRHRNSSESDYLLVKVRIANSGEEDFIEVETDGLTYTGLLKAICGELEVSVNDIVKIRKLPNVLIRKDKDVARLVQGQELEVVLKPGVVYQPLVPTYSTFSQFVGQPMNTLVSTASTIPLPSINTTMISEGQSILDSSAHN